MGLRLTSEQLQNELNKSNVDIKDRKIAIGAQFLFMFYI